MFDLQLNNAHDTAEALMKDLKEKFSIKPPNPIANVYPQNYNSEEGKQLGIELRLPRVHQ